MVLQRHGEGAGAAGSHEAEDEGGRERRAKAGIGPREQGARKGDGEGDARPTVDALAQRQNAVARRCGDELAGQRRWRRTR